MLREEVGLDLFPLAFHTLLPAASLPSPLPPPTASGLPSSHLPNSHQLLFPPTSAPMLIWLWLQLWQASALPCLGHKACAWSRLITVVVAAPTLALLGPRPSHHHHCCSWAGLELEQTVPQD